MERPCTPGEVARWRHQLRSLDRERQGAVIRLLAERVGTCPACEGPVRRSDPRRLVEGRLHHLACAEAAT